MLKLAMQQVLAQPAWLKALSSAGALAAFSQLPKWILASTPAVIRLVRVAFLAALKVPILNWIVVKNKPAVKADIDAVFAALKALGDAVDQEMDADVDAAQELPPPPPAPAGAQIPPAAPPAAKP